MKLDDEGLAYGWMMLCLYFGAGAVIWLCWAFIFNIFLVSQVNPAIVAGTISLQTAHATQWNVDVLRYGVPLILILGFIFGTNRAIFKGKGSS